MILNPIHESLRIFFKLSESVVFKPPSVEAAQKIKKSYAQKQRGEIGMTLSGASSQANIYIVAEGHRFFPKKYLRE
jgi:hypothetical protein